MTELRRSRRGVRAATTAAALVLIATAVGARRGVAGWEITASRWIVDRRSVTGLLELVMSSGTRVAVVVAVVVAATAGARSTAWVIGGAGALAWLAAELGREVVGRARPDTELLGRSLRNVVEGFGYPSTHTAMATAIAVAVLWRHPKLGWPLLVLPVATAAARIHLGAHWPLDVLGGAAIGVIAAGLTTLAVDRTDPRPWPVPVVAPVGGDRPRRPGTTRVATFNIRNGRALLDGRHLWWLRRGITARAILDLDADVIGLQEGFGFQLRTLARALPEFSWVGVGRDDGGRRGEHTAVFWRTDRFELRSSVTRWFGDEPDRPGTRLPGARFPRTATLVTLASTEADASLLFVNTHLDADGGQRRVASAGQLVSWVDDAAPAVVVGDMNAAPGSRPLEVLAGHGWRRVVTVAGAEATEPATSHDYRPAATGSIIDHIFASSDLEVLGGAVWAGIDACRLPSDHWPVTADLGWPSVPSNGQSSSTSGV